MEHQSDINSAMRTILIDWLIEVADEYKLNDETLFLCIQYVDRFLSTVNVTRSKLQLLGTTCMYIASKYEEMYPPALDEFSFITDNTYETKHILRMEQIIMKVKSKFCFRELKIQKKIYFFYRCLISLSPDRLVIHLCNII
jgi:cyclin A